MSKFKVGDKVRILDGSKIKGYTGNWFWPLMKKHVGEVHTIASVDSDWSGGRVAYCLKDVGFAWDERGLDLVKETIPKKIVITSNGKTTTAALYDGKRRIKSTEARCSDSDVFDFMTGAEIAMDRLTGHPHKEAIPSDLRELLAEGVFGKSKYGLFVVINKRLVFQSGGFNFVAEYSPNLTSRYDLIEWIVEGACSFGNAEDKFTENKGIVWKR